MKKTFKSLMVVVLLLTVAFALAGCGSNDAERLRAQLDAKTAELTEVKNDLQEALAQVADLQGQINSDASAQTIAQLNATLAALNAQFESLNEELALLKSKLEALGAAYKPETVTPNVSRVVGYDADGNPETVAVQANAEVKVDAGTTEFVADLGNASYFYGDPEWTSSDSKAAISGGFLDILPDDVTASAISATITVTFKSLLEGQDDISFNFTVKADQYVMPVLTGKTITVGTPQLNGEFMFEFGNSSYDNNVRSLIYGYSTVISDPNGQLVLDTTVVTNLSESLGAQRVVGEGENQRTVQDKTFTFTLNPNLKWNDGTSVTADDYIFTLLWNASHQYAAAGASTTLGEFLVGYADYSGAADATAVYFKGVKKISNTVFSLTVDGENLPYFYELSTVLVTPYPMHVFAPQASIISDENGSKLSANAFEKLNTLIGPNGYRFNPAVTCGPYKFVSFKNQVVVLQKNTLYVGDYTGKKPAIDNIIVKWINQDTDVDQVIAGAVDLVSGVIEGSKIESAKAASTVNAVSYLRNGYGQISFATDFGPTKDVNVRTALAYLLNRQEFLTTILQGYGAVVNGEYGLSQWMYQEKQAEVESKLVNYTLDPAKANQYLDKTEYKFEKDGVTPFDASKAKVGSGYYRYNAQKQVLQINHFGTNQNAVTDLIETQWKANTQLAGIKFTIDKGGFDALLSNYYFGYELKPEDRKYNSFNLATGFTAIYDPYYSYHTDFLNTWMNANQLSDPALDQLMESMRQLSPDQTKEFADLWLQYQIRWNQLLPNIPLYSNEYFDVVSKRVTSYEVTSLWEWGYALLYADVQ